MYNISQSAKTNFNPKVDQFKEQLINYIYNTIELSKFKFELLQFESELKQLTEKKYFLSANFSGSNCLLVFMKIKDKYNAFMVDRKKLSYNFSKIDFNKIDIINVSVKLDTSIYKGSIFDGTYIQTKTEKVFVITDCYYFKGEDMTNTGLDKKMLSIRTYLESNYNSDDLSNNLLISLNKLYNIDQIENVSKNIIPKIKNYSVRGICLYPDVSGTKLIYMFGNENRENPEQTNNYVSKGVQKPYMTNQNYDNRKKQVYENNQTRYTKPTYQIKTVQPSYKIQQTHQTHQLPQESQPNQLTHTSDISKKYAPKKDINPSSYIFEMMVSADNSKPDIYVLNCVEPIVKDNRTHLKRIRIGLAYIPNLSTSKWCREITENAISESKKYILVNCKYHSDKNKWEPFQISNEKRPSFISDFES